MIEQIFLAHFLGGGEGMVNFVRCNSESLVELGGMIYTISAAIICPL